MVLAKPQAQKTIEDSFKYVEAVIDAKLSTGKRSVLTSLIREFLINYNDLDDVIQLIMSRYQQGGWNVKREKGYDQRDNDNWDYLTFS